MIVIKKSASNLTIADGVPTDIFGAAEFPLQGTRVWCFTFVNEGAHDVTIRVSKRAGPGAGLIEFTGLTQVVAEGETLALEFGSESCTHIGFTGEGMGGDSDGCNADFIGRA